MQWYLDHAGLDLTANHCFTGEHQDCLPVAEAIMIPNTTGDVTVSFSPFPEGASVDFQHTLQRSGLVRGRKNAEIDSCSRFDSSRDIALFQLDTRVPSSVALPLHPPTTAFSCLDAGTDPGNFSGTLVGYGRTEVFSPIDSPPARTFSISAGWGRISTDGSGNEYTYTNHWIVPFFPPIVSSPWYQGIIGGTRVAR